MESDHVFIRESRKLAVDEFLSESRYKLLHRFVGGPTAMVEHISLIVPVQMYNELPVQCGDKCLVRVSVSWRHGLDDAVYLCPASFVKMSLNTGDFSSPTALMKPAKSSTHIVYLGPLSACDKRLNGAGFHRNAKLLAVRMGASCPSAWSTMFFASQARRMGTFWLCSIWDLVVPREPGQSGVGPQRRTRRGCHSWGGCLLTTCLVSHTTVYD